MLSVDYSIALEYVILSFKANIQTYPLLIESLQNIYKYNIKHITKFLFYRNNCIWRLFENIYAKMKHLQLCTLKYTKIPVFLQMALYTPRRMLFSHAYQVVKNKPKSFDAIPGPSGRYNLPYIGHVFHFKPFGELRILSIFYINWGKRTESKCTNSWKF